MQGKKYLLLMGVLFINNIGYAICVKNDSSYPIYYEIYNKNTNPAPKVKFHSGVIYQHEKKCHAHSQQEGDDWKIYRKDDIKAYKIDLNTNQKELVCRKQVNGILNTLEIDYAADLWWCLDRSDHQD